MSSKLKDKKIIIYKTISTTSSSGYVSKKYIPIHPGKLWAYVRQLSQREVFAARAVQNTEDIVFIINWRDDLSATESFVNYKGKWFDVTRIDAFEDYKSDIMLYASTMGINTPKAADVLPYEG